VGYCYNAEEIRYWRKIKHWNGTANWTVSWQYVTLLQKFQQQKTQLAADKSCNFLQLWTLWSGGGTSALVPPARPQTGAVRQTFRASFSETGFSFFTVKQSAFNDYVSEHFSSVLLLAARGLWRHQAQRDVHRSSVASAGCSGRRQNNPFCQMLHSNSSLRHKIKHCRLKETHLMSTKK
jgi:hypothetical protein